MAEITITLKDKKIVAERTMAFCFEKPKGFSYQAGQYIELSLINPDEGDDKGNTRALSLASAPHEPNIVVVTRMRDSAFKRQLSRLSYEEEVRLSGPFGSFVLHADTKKAAVFLTGGVGITPVMSIASDATQRKLPHKLFLFYSSAKPETAVFLGEFFALRARNSNFLFVPTMTNPEKSKVKWDGERSLISFSMIRKYMPEHIPSVYYITGPPGFVKGMHKMLTDGGIDRDLLRLEEFAGY